MLVAECAQCSLHDAFGIPAAFAQFFFEALQCLAVAAAELLEGAYRDHAAFPLQAPGEPFLFLLESFQPVAHARV